MKVVGQRPQRPQSLLDVSEPHRQVHEADPRTNRATCRVKEADREIRGALADDGSDADNLRKQACLARGTLRANLAAVLLRLHHQERGVHQTHWTHFRLERREGDRADQNGRRRNGIVCRPHPRRRLKEGSLNPHRHRCVSVTTAMATIMAKETVHAAGQSAAYGQSQAHCRRAAEAWR